MDHFDAKTQDSDRKTGIADTFNAPDHPELYEGVVSRRVFAFLIDVTIIGLLSCAVFMVTLVLGVFTFGLAWLALGLVFPGVALLYTGFGLSGLQSATIGMRMMDLKVITWSGQKLDFMLAVFHAIGFYVSVVILAPFILAIALFEPRGRLLHDLLLGTVIVDRQAADRIF